MSKYASMESRDRYFVPDTAGVRVPRTAAQDEYGGDDPSLSALALEVATLRVQVMLSKSQSTWEGTISTYPDGDSVGMY